MQESLKEANGLVASANEGQTVLKPYHLGILEPWGIILVSMVDDEEARGKIILMSSNFCFPWRKMQNGQIPAFGHYHHTCQDVNTHIYVYIDI